MGKVEKYIKEHTNRYSNHVELAPYITGFTEWLTIDDARRVAEVVKEETIKEVCEWLNNHYMDYMHNPTGKQLEAFFGMDIVEDLKKHLEDKG